MEELTPEVLRRLYENQLLTEQQIADQFGTYQIKVNRLRKKWDIPTIGKTGRLTRKLPDLTEKQSDLLIGSLLGDGHMFSRSDLTAGFSEGHSLAQEGYTRWKANIMEPFTCRIYPGSKKTSDRVYHTLNFATHVCTYLRPYYDLFYPPPRRVRVFPKNLDSMITPLALAVWYMDDGSLYSRYHPRISFGLDPLSLKRALKALRAMGFTPKVHGNSDGSDQAIHFPGCGDLFFETIQPLVPECMAYKLSRPDSPRRLIDKNAKRLTPERAALMYEGGLSFREIATIWGVGTSTVKRRVAKAGGVSRSPGRKPARVSVVAATEVLSTCDTKTYNELIKFQKIQKVDEVYAVLSKTEFPLDEFSDEEIPIDLDKLNGLTPYLEDGEIRPQTWRGTILCKRFFPNRYKAVSGPSKISAYEAWFTEKNLRAAIKMQFGSGHPVVPHRVLRAITAQVRTPTIFRPIVAKYLYSKYVPQGGTVWDPCSGYGGRLLGAFASGVKYVGTDVDPETLEGNRKLAEAIGYEDVDLHLSPAEEFRCPPVDFVFTSPPYFDREQYAGGDQSWKRYENLESWVSGFLTPVMKTAHGALDGGAMAINIADLKVRKKVIPLVSRTIQAAESVGFKHVETLKMPLSKLNRENPWEPILIFR